MLNSDIAYLLGMIVGKGQIIRDNETTKIIIEIPHKNLLIRGEDAQKSTKLLILEIIKRIEPLIESKIDWDTESKNRTYIFFSKKNNSQIAREIHSYLEGKTNWRDFRIPKEIFSATNDIKKEFLRGLADVTAHIRESNLAYGIDYNHRVYFEIMTNWDLCIDISNLLKGLDIPVQTIRFAHPNIVDPNLKKYNFGNKEFWNKEHEIKIWAEEFEKIGFNIEHKNKLLKEFADLNRKNWKKANKKISISDAHHKFYWETKKLNKEKVRHPEEENSKLPSRVRKHYNSWKEIAAELGYYE